MAAAPSNCRTPSIPPVESFTGFSAKRLAESQNRPQIPQTKQLIMVRFNQKPQRSMLFTERCEFVELAGVHPEGLWAVASAMMPSFATSIEKLDRAGNIRFGTHR